MSTHSLNPGQPFRFPSAVQENLVLAVLCLARACPRTLRKYGYIQSDRLLSWQHFPVPVHDACQFSSRSCAVSSMQSSRKMPGCVQMWNGCRSSMGMSTSSFRACHVCDHALSAFALQPVHANVPAPANLRYASPRVMRRSN